MANEEGLPAHGTMCKVSPEAWMEGQRKKGWTLIIILMLFFVARDRDTKVSRGQPNDNNPDTFPREVKGERCNQR